MPLTPAQKRATDPVRSAWKAMPNHKLIPALESRLGEGAPIAISRLSDLHEPLSFTQPRDWLTARHTIT